MTKAQEGRLKALGSDLEHKGILDHSFVYTPSCSTSILDTFKRLGWVPPSEAKRQREMAMIGRQSEGA